MLITDGDNNDKYTSVFRKRPKAISNVADVDGVEIGNGVGDIPIVEDIESFETIADI